MLGLRWAPRQRGSRFIKRKKAESQNANSDAVHSRRIDHMAGVDRATRHPVGSPAWPLARLAWWRWRWHRSLVPRTPTTRRFLADRRLGARRAESCSCIIIPRRRLNCELLRYGTHHAATESRFGWSYRKEIRLARRAPPMILHGMVRPVPSRTNPPRHWHTAFSGRPANRPPRIAVATYPSGWTMPEGRTRIGAWLPRQTQFAVPLVYRPDR